MNTSHASSHRRTAKPGNKLNGTSIFDHMPALGRFDGLKNACRVWAGYSVLALQALRPAYAAFRPLRVSHCITTNVTGWPSLPHLKCYP